MNETTENYLENIYMLGKENCDVRAIDLANKMNYSKPTISIRLKKLRDDGFINIDSNSFITLTNEGLNVAKKIMERHNVIATMLIRIGVNKKTAYEDACKIEHHISKETFVKLKEHYEKVK